MWNHQIYIIYIELPSGYLTVNHHTSSEWAMTSKDFSPLADYKKNNGGYRMVPPSDVLVFKPHENIH